MMGTENNFKQEKQLKLTQFCNFEVVLLEKSAFLKIAVRAFETGEHFFKVLGFLRLVFL